MNLAAGYVRGPGKIEKMPAIRQKLRPAMGVFVACSVQLGCGYPKEACKWRRGKHDQAIPVPGPAAPFGRWTKHLDRTARGIDCFELTVGKETDGMSVGGPKWKRGPFCPGQDIPSVSLPMVSSKQ